MTAGTTGHAGAFANAYEGADFRCQYSATQASLPGIWRAHLSFSTLNGINKLSIRAPVFNMNDQQLATGYTDFWDGTLAYPIRYSETNTSINGTDDVMTGTSVVGGYWTGWNCNNWTDSSGGSAAKSGSSSSAFNWSFTNEGSICSATKRLYCMSQFVPALDDFSVITGSGADGTTEITVNYPSDAAEYGSVTIRRLAGATPPSLNCTDGTLAATLTTFTDTTFTDTSGSPGAPFSYRACVYDLNGRLAFSNHTVSNVKAQGAYQTMFVSSTSYNGNLGGLSGADAICQGLADAESLGGTWKAVISSEAVNVKDRIAVTGAVYNLGNSLLALNSADMWDGSLGNAVLYDESGLNVGAWGDVWAGSLNNGTKWTGWNCSSWSNGSSGASAYLGGSDQSSSGWIQTNSGTNCANTKKLYCIDGQ
jgi:hypothetical protein